MNLAHNVCFIDILLEEGVYSTFRLSLCFVVYSAVSVDKIRE